MQVEHTSYMVQYEAVQSEKPDVGFYNRSTIGATYSGGEVVAMAARKSADTIGTTSSSGEGKTRLLGSTPEVLKRWRIALALKNSSSKTPFQACRGVAKQDVLISFAVTRGANLPQRQGILTRRKEWSGSSGQWELLAAEFVGGSRNSPRCMRGGSRRSTRSSPFLVRRTQL